MERNIKVKESFIREIRKKALNIKRKGRKYQKISDELSDFVYNKLDKLDIDLYEYIKFEKFKYTRRGEYDGWKGGGAKTIERLFKEKKCSIELFTVIGRYLFQEKWAREKIILFRDLSDLSEEKVFFDEQRKTNLNNHLGKEISDLVHTLQILYEQNKIYQGYRIVNEKYNSLILTKDNSVNHNLLNINPRFLRHVFRFNMRMRNWKNIELIVGNILFNKVSDFIKTLCSLALLECEIRASYLVVNKNKRADKVLSSAVYFSDIPDSMLDFERYLYWKGRWHLEVWYINEEKNFLDLKFAELYFNKALEKKDMWWCLGYKCIVMSLLGYDIEENIGKLESIMLKICSKKPKLASAKTYRMLSIILQNDEKLLLDYLEELNTPTSPSDFQATIFHHLELLFYKEDDKLKKFTKILENWLSKLPTK